MAQAPEDLYPTQGTMFTLSDDAPDAHLFTNGSAAPTRTVLPAGSIFKFERMRQKYEDNRSEVAKTIQVIQAQLPDGRSFMLKCLNPSQLIPTVSHR